MLSINTNTSSYITQRSLKNSTQLLNQAIERMTTGYKLNHASDNAANYSISTNQTTKLSAYQVAEDNCAMGLDFITTADDTLNLIQNNLTRLRDLAEQAANGTYGKDSIRAINAEAKAIINEIYRVKNSAEYNQQNLFGASPIDDGSVGAQGLEVLDSGFMQEVKKRDTSSMTKMASVNENAKLAKGTYSISTADELAKLAKMQNAGNITEGSEFVLASDIDLIDYSSGKGWKPIGHRHDFSGIFDGNGYKITNLYINSSDYWVGLFGGTKGGTIKNLGIESGEIKTTNPEAGAFVGHNQDAVINISNCYSKINVTSSDKSGGIIGQGIDANIEYCYATGNISSAGPAGGLVASGVTLNITNCFATGTVNGENGVGGLLGRCGTTLTLSNCFATGDVEGNDNIGALIGNAAGSRISNSHSTGNVKCNNSGAGGILGNCSSGIEFITNSYATGNIQGTEAVGGIIGWLDCGNTEINNCHFAGQVTGETKVGAIAGGDEVDTCTLKNCTYNGGDVAGSGKAILENIQNASRSVGLQVGINADENSQINLDSLFVLGGLNDIFVLGLQSNKSLSIIDNYIAKASEVQTRYGSTENRLESALEEISTHYENVASSRSTLRDADIAKVSSEYIRQQILQQASATLMATANQSPSIALQLL